MRAIRGRTMIMLVALLALWGCTAVPSKRFAPASISLPQAPVVMPMKVVRSLPLVPVSVDGTGPHWFVLDTGAEATVVSTRLAKRLGWQTIPGNLDVVGADGEVIRDAGVHPIAELNIGEIRLQQTQAIVLPMEHLRSALGEELEGVLGFGCFTDALLRLDYAAESWSLSRGNRLSDRLEGAMPFELSGGLPRILVDVGAWKLPLIVDTGSAETLALNSDTLPHEAWAHGPVDGHRSTTIGGTATRNQLGRLAPNLGLGGHTIQAPIAFLTQGPARIGGALLRHFHLSFDLQAGLMRLERSDGARDALLMPALRTTGLSLRRDHSGWWVQDVVPHTPAAYQGIEVGDRITSVNGMRALALSREDWNVVQDQSAFLDLKLLRLEHSYERRIPIIDLVP